MASLLPARDLLVLLATILSTGVTAEKPPEIKEYRTDISFDEEPSDQMKTDEFLTSLKRVVEKNISATFTEIRWSSWKELVFTYDNDSTTQALEALVSSGDDVSSGFDELLRNNMDGINITVIAYDTYLVYNDYQRLWISVEGYPQRSAALPDDLPVALGKDIAAQINRPYSPVYDVHVAATSPSSFMAIVRIESAYAYSPNFKALPRLNFTAASLGVTASDLEVGDRKFLFWNEPSRFFVTIDYNDSPQKNKMTQLLLSDKQTDYFLEDLQFQFFLDMDRFLGWHYISWNKLYPVILNVSNSTFTVAYEIPDLQMWSLARRLKEESGTSATTPSFPLTAVSAYLNLALSTNESVEVQHVKIVAMEQPDVGKVPWPAFLKVKLMGLEHWYDWFDERRPDPPRSKIPLCIALRNGLMKTLNLTDGDLLPFYIDFSSDRYGIGDKTNPDVHEVLDIWATSEEAYNKISNATYFGDYGFNESVWLAEARVIEPTLTVSYPRNDDDDDGTSCRVGRVHCGHITGIVVLLVATCVIFALGFYFIIYRPSKKRQRNEVSKLPEKHDFVFSSSFGASTRRSAASSMYERTRAQAMSRLSEKTKEQVEKGVDSHNPAA